MIEQRTPEWFAQRVGRVTGSVVGAILGLSPYQTRSDVLRSMVRAYHGAPSEFTGNVATEWGTYNEAGAIADFELETGLTVSPMPFMAHEDWLGASPDGSVSDGAGLEVKCPFGIRGDHNPLFRTLDEQPHYYAQCQTEMFCCGWDRLHFFQWTPHGSEITAVARDDDWLATNIPALRQFHAEYLDELSNPDHLAPRRAEIDTPDAHKAVREYDELVEAIERATERKAELLANIVDAAGQKDTLYAGRKLTKVTRTGSVAYAKVVKAKLPDLDLDPWRGKPSVFWQLT